MEKTERMVPRLRFAGFEGSWEEKTIGEISLKVNSGKTPLGGEKAYTEEGIIFIRSQNVFSDKLDLTNQTFISSKTNEEMKNSVVYPNDILLNITGASLGRSCVVPENFAIGNVNQHVCIIRLKKDYFPRFVQPILSSEKGQLLFESLQTGSGREGLNFQTIKGLKISIPDIVEQKKIATFLQTANTKIDFLQKKKSLLEQYKKGMMQKLFSREVRFRDEEFGEWEEKTLGEIAIIKYGKDQKQVVDENGIYPILGTGGEIGRTNSFICNKPSVLIGRKGTIDKPMYFDTPFWTVDTLFYTEINSNCLPKWVFYLFQTIDWYTYNEASGVPSLSGSTISKILVSVPQLKEQTKIAGFLSALDVKIAGVAAQIEKMEKWKKGLLGEMFV
jgi:type I restriction enzyme S subunit